MNDVPEWSLLIRWVSRGDRGCHPPTSAGAGVGGVLVVVLCVCVQGSAGGFNHTDGLETQHFLSAESSFSSAAMKSQKCLLLRHRRELEGPS